MQEFRAAYSQTYYTQKNPTSQIFTLDRMDLIALDWTGVNK